MVYKFYQSIFNFDGAVQLGQERQTIADWLNMMTRLHGVISTISVTVLSHGLLVIVGTQTQETHVGV